MFTEVNKDEKAEGNKRKGVFREEKESRGKESDKNKVWSDDRCRKIGEPSLHR